MLRIVNETRLRKPQFGTRECILTSTLYSNFRLDVKARLPTRSYSLLGLLALPIRQPLQHKRRPLVARRDAQPLAQVARVEEPLGLLAQK